MIESIPTNLRMYRIMGRNRREPCVCGHFHNEKSYQCSIAYMDSLVEETKAMEKRFEHTPIPPYTDQEAFNRWINIEMERKGKNFKWIERPTEWVKITPYGEIAIKKSPKRG